MACPLAEADDRPHGATERAAAAETPAEQPPDVDWKCFPERDIHSGNCSFELLRCHPGVKKVWKIGVEPIRQSEHCDVPRSSNDDRIGDQGYAGRLEDR